MKIVDKKIILTLIKPNEKDEFFTLATKSFGSKFWYDDQQKEKNSKKAFFKDWVSSYFNLKKPQEGQCFWIILNKEKIGAICYNKFDLLNKKTELDIIIGDKKYLGLGYGTEALKTLINYLFKNYKLHKIWIEARGNNLRAINAYKKAGFKVEGILKDENFFNEKFVDCVRFGIINKHENI